MRRLTRLGWLWVGRGAEQDENERDRRHPVFIDFIHAADSILWEERIQRERGRGAMAGVNVSTVLMSMMRAGTSDAARPVLGRRSAAVVTRQAIISVYTPNLSPRSVVRQRL